MQIKCECTGTVFHLDDDEGGTTARCANPECGRGLFNGAGEMVFVGEVQDGGGEPL
jgi:hypothetical protein